MREMPLRTQRREVRPHPLGCEPRRIRSPQDGLSAGRRPHRLEVRPLPHSRRIPPAARKVILMKDLRRTYLGLSTACATCHEDKHNGQVGDKCDRCHTVAKWKDVTRFDHSTARYKLTGAHAKVECAKCHATLPSPVAASRVDTLHRNPVCAVRRLSQGPASRFVCRGLQFVSQRFRLEAREKYGHPRSTIPRLNSRCSASMRRWRATSATRPRISRPRWRICSARPATRTSMGGNSPHARTRATAQAAIPPMAGSLPRIR